MLLEDDVLGFDGRADGAASEVEDEHDVVAGNALLKIAAAIDERLAGSQLHLSVIEEGVDVVLFLWIVGELDGHGHVLIGEKGDTEVVHLVSRGCDTALELGLSHPFASSDALGDGHCDSVACSDLIIRGDASGPVAGGVPGLDVQRSGFPEIGFSVEVILGGIERLDGFRFRSVLTALRNEFVVPGDAVFIARSVHGGHHLELLLHIGSFCLEDQETRILHCALVGHVGHYASGSEHQVDLLDARVVPVALEGIFACSLLNGEEIVFAGIVLGLVFGSGIGIGHAVTGIECVIAFRVEGHHVVIEEAFLSVRIAFPPAKGISDGTAAEVGVLLTVPYPVLGSSAGDGTDVRRRIERIAIGIVQREGLDQGTLAETVGIVGLDLHGVLAFFAEAERESVLGIGVALGGLAVDFLVAEDPHRNHALVVHHEGDVVGLLVDSDGHIQI